MHHFSRYLWIYSLLNSLNMLVRRCLPIIIGLLYTLTGVINAQTTFQKSYGLPNYSSDAKDLIEIQGGFLVAGGAVHPVTGLDGLLMKLDTAGNVVWEKTYHLDGQEIFYSVVAAGDGGFVVLGEIQTSADVWALKVDANGDIVWQLQFDRPNGGISGNRVLAVPGGFVLSGATGADNGITSSYLVRINHLGQILWDHSYQSPTNNLMRIGYITDSLWYASGSTGLNASLFAVDPQMGDVIKSMEFSAVGSEVLANLAPTPDGNLILSDFVQPFWPTSAMYFPWVQKISPDGTVIWSKMYQIEGQPNINGPVVPIPTGGYLVCPGSGTNAPTVDTYLIKIDEDGQVIWCHSFGNPNGHDWFLKAFPTNDGGFIAAGVTAAAIPGRNNIFVVKLNAKGQLNGCCPNPKNVNTTDFPTILSNTVLTKGSFFPGLPSFGTTQIGNNPEKTMPCTNPSPTLEVQYSFCPDETFFLNGQEYTIPDTLVINIPSLSGECDTIATYYLLDEIADQTSTIQLQCPADIVKTIASGTTAVAVTYPLPDALTDCTCEGLEFENLSGGASGSLFPLGSHPVCWQVKDACGTVQQCCFNITVEEEMNACDIKSIACFKWELLDRKLTQNQDLVYRIRVTNQCSSRLKYFYFGVPSGISALEPVHNSIYESLSDRQYLVKNPNFSPFYGLRFQSVADGLNNGASDIFRIVLPKQVNPDYLHVAGKLDEGTYSEAYLNTFNCPIGQEKNSADRGVLEAPSFARVLLSPNPLVPGKQIQIESSVLINGQIKLYNAHGTEIFQALVFENQVLGDTSLLPEGMCFFQVFDESAVQLSGILFVNGKQ